MFVLTLVWMQKQNIISISTWKEESSSLLLWLYLGAQRRRSRRFPWLGTSSTGMRRTTPWRGAGAAGEEWRMERWDIKLWLNEFWSVVRGCWLMWVLFKSNFIFYAYAKNIFICLSLTRKSRWVEENVSTFLVLNVRSAGSNWAKGNTPILEVKRPD